MNDTRSKILDTAQELCQQRGHQGFSFRDIAKTLNIKSASVHHHFANKDALLLALVERYSTEFFLRYSELQKKSEGPTATLTALANDFASLLAERGRLCLCGMLAAEYEPLSPEVRTAINNFFGETTNQIAELLTMGQQKGELFFKEDPKVIARSILSAFQGMLLSSRLHGGKEAFQNMSGWMISQLAAPKDQMLPATNNV